MRTRSNVNTLIKNENTKWPAALVSYEKGVAAMRAYDPPETTPATRGRRRAVMAVSGRGARPRARRQTRQTPAWRACPTCSPPHHLWRCHGGGGC
jgi:Ser/Thr protein kinase RdoA (MazF antagonist)